MPAPRKQSPNSPATDQAPATRGSLTRAQALRWWQAGYQAGHQAAEHEQHAAAQWHNQVASYHAQHAADQQASINALLLDVIDALASLFTSQDDDQT